PSPNPSGLRPLKPLVRGLLERRRRRGPELPAANLTRSIRAPGLRLVERVERPADLLARPLVVHLGAVARLAVALRDHVRAGRARTRVSGLDSGVLTPHLFPSFFG